MSHVAAVEVVVKDLAALKAAGERLGFEFMEGQDHTSVVWALPERLGEAATRLNALRRIACVQVPNFVGSNPFLTAARLLGVVARPDGDGFDLVYDSYGTGHQLEEAAGVDLVRLRNEVAAEVTVGTLTRRGYRVTREETEANTIRLVAVQ